MTADGLDPARIARVVAALADGERDPRRTLCAASADVVGVSGAGVVLLSQRRTLGNVCVSDPVIQAVEDVQYVLGEGPCVDAFNTRAPVLVADLAADERWPEFRRGALGSRDAGGVRVPAAGRAELHRGTEPVQRPPRCVDRRTTRGCARSRPRRGSDRVGVAGHRRARPAGVAVGTCARQPGRGASSLGHGLRASRACRSAMPWRCSARTPLPRIARSAKSPPMSSPADCASTEPLHGGRTLTTRIKQTVRKGYGMEREELLVETLVTLADTLVDTYDLIDFMQTLAERCVELLDVSEAGIMLADPDGKLRHVACSSEQMRLVELFELQVEEGPCFDAYSTHAAVSCDSLRGRTGAVATIRAARARGRLRSGFGGADATALPGDRRAQPVLDPQHRTRPSATSPSRRPWPTSPPIGILQERAIHDSRAFSAQLEVALDSRIVIEQAKGIVAERNRVGVDEAFQQIRQFARNHNRLLSETAREIVVDALLPASLTGRKPSPRPSVHS